MISADSCELAPYLLVADKNFSQLGKIGKCCMSLWDMTYGQIGAGLKRLGDLAGVTEEDWQRMLTNDELAKRVGVPFVASQSSDLLLLLPLDWTVTIPASPEPFNPAAKFVVDTSEAAELPISFMSENTRRAIGNVVEPPTTTETKLHPRILQLAATGGKIVEALGGKTRASITPREVYLFLKEANYNKWYLFIINSWVVHARWYVSGWSLDAYVASRPGSWNVGFLVVARD